MRVTCPNCGQGIEVEPIPPDAEGVGMRLPWHSPRASGSACLGSLKVVDTETGEVAR